MHWYPHETRLAAWCMVYSALSVRKSKSTSQRFGGRSGLMGVRLPANCSDKKATKTKLKNPDGMFSGVFLLQTPGSAYLVRDLVAFTCEGFPQRLSGLQGTTLAQGVCFASKSR